MATAKKASTKVSAQPPETTDIERIKAMLADLSAKAVLAITKKRNGEMGASNRLSMYARAHAVWLDALEAPNAAEKSGARKVATQLRKLQSLHNKMLVTDGYSAFAEKLEAATTKEASTKLLRKREKYEAALLQARGIGDRTSI